jgi:hypothetical protein
MFFIYGVSKQQQVTFVGCVKDLQEIPGSAIILQETQDHAEVHWVKWCRRFRRTLTDQAGLNHRFAAYFTNSAKLNRLLSGEGWKAACAGKSADFLRYHEDNTHLLEELIANARAEKAAGREMYSVAELLGDLRWGDTETERGGSRFKIASKFSSWYSRAVQMTSPDLVGFFGMQFCQADGLVWTEGRSWMDFAAENADALRWSEPWDELPDSDFSYSERTAGQTK